MECRHDFAGEALDLLHALGITRHHELKRDVLHSDLVITLERFAELLGRVALYEAVLDQSAIENRQSKIERAREQLIAAVDGLRRAGTMDHLPRGLLSRAWLRFLEGDPSTGSTSSPQAGSGQALDGVRADLDEAWEIAERGPMRLHMADIHLYRARLFHDKESPAKAAQLIKQCGYWRRKEELADAEEAAKQW